MSSVIPQANGSAITDPHTFNSSKGELKLGPPPLPEELRTETERVLREQAMIDRDPNAQYDAHHTRPAPIPGVVAPSLSDLPPHPPSFKTIDVKREVEKVRDMRKRIRLEPSVLSNVNAQQAAAVRYRALPSICTYTLHDVGEGYVRQLNSSRCRLTDAQSNDSAPCCAFSEDTSVMAAGFSESYIRLWSLKGEKLKGYRSDFQSSSIRDGMDRSSFTMSL